MQQLGSGQLALDQAEKIFALIENACKLLETQNLEKRVRAIEQLLPKEVLDKAA
jgi:uncharacterized protein YerC